MQPVPQVRVSAYLPFVHFLDGQRVLRPRGADDALLAAVAERDVETLVPIHLAHSFLERGARAAGLSDLGYVVGRDMRLESLGAFGRSLLRSLTLHDALGKVRAKFGLYSSAERIWWTRTGDDVSVFHAYTTETGPGSRVARQVVLLLFRDLVRLVAGRAWQPGEVLTPDAALDARAMRDIFKGAAIRHSRFAGIVFPARFLSLPLDRSRLLSLGGDPDDAAFEACAPAGDLAGSIKQVIAAQIRLGQCQIGRTAEMVGMHPRSLQRRLAAVDREFSELLAEVRFEEAQRMIGDAGYRMIDIALELGYADSANFTRAFRQWTGVSPSQFRQMLRSGAVAK